MGTHAIFRSDLMQATTQAADQVSVKLTVDTDNGNFLKVKGLAAGEANVYLTETPDKATSLDDIVVLATPEVLYDERFKDLSDFSNNTSRPALGLRLRKGGIFSVTAAALDGTPQVGGVVELQNGTKGKATATLTAGSTKIGDIIEIAGGYIAIRI